jgi:hypothetical protein
MKGKRAALAALPAAIALVAAASAAGAQYAVAPGKASRVVLRLHAEGNFDAAAVLLKRFRSQTDDVVCIRTDRKGDGILAWDVEKGASYFVVIGGRSGSAPGDSTLRALAAQPREAAPGLRLPPMA